MSDAPEDMKGTVATPTSNHLFKINEKCDNMLTEERIDAFVHVVMQVLYLSQQRARPNAWIKDQGGHHGHRMPGPGSSGQWAEPSIVKVERCHPMVSSCVV